MDRISKTNVIAHICDNLGVVSAKQLLNTTAIMPYRIVFGRMLHSMMLLCRWKRILVKIKHMMKKTLLRACVNEMYNAVLHVWGV